jgi:hypothetical protein
MTCTTWAPNPPFGYSPNLTNVYFSTPNVSVENGLTATAPNYPAGITALAYTDYRLPVSAQWNFGVQREVSRGAVLSVAYVGNADYHQRDEREINDVPLSDPNRLAIAGISGHYNANLDRAYLGYSNIVLGENASNTHYESLQVNFRVENQHGLTFQAAYTWSHSLGHRAGRRWGLQHSLRSLQPVLRLRAYRSRPAAAPGAELHLRSAYFPGEQGYGWHLAGGLGNWLGSRSSRAVWP